MHRFDQPQIKHDFRYIDPSCVHHVMSKTWGGLYLMTPKDEVREIITGILAQAKMKYPEIKLHYDVFGFDAAAYAVAKNKASNLKNPPLIPRKDCYQKRQIHLDVLKLYAKPSKENDPPRKDPKTAGRKENPWCQKGEIPKHLQRKPTAVTPILEGEKTRYHRLG